MQIEEEQKTQPDSLKAQDNQLVNDVKGEWVEVDPVQPKKKTREDKKGCLLF